MGRGGCPQARPDRLEGMVFGADVSAVAALLRGMSEAETVVADLWVTGITRAAIPPRASALARNQEDSHYQLLSRLG